MDSEEDKELYEEFRRTVKYQFKCTHEMLHKEKLYAGQPPLLFALLREEGQRQKDIANKLNIKASTVNVMVKRLEKAGFLEKRVDELDKRVSRLYLTDKGREICINARQAVKNVQNKVFDALNQEEKNTFKELLKKINKNLNNNNDNKF